MRKKGFSLSELIVALGIIGVVAALTIPQFATSTEFKSLAAKLSSTVTDVENVFGMMLYEEDVEELQDTELGKAKSDADRKTALEKYTTILAFGTTSVALNYSSCSASLLVPPVYAGELSAKSIKGNSSEPLKFDYGFKIENGAVVFIYNDPSAVSPGNGGNPISMINLYKMAGILDSVKVALKGQPAYAAVNTSEWRRVWIDVNGGSKPNMLGRDIFTFVLGNDGHLYPYGSDAAGELIGYGTSKNWSLSSAGNDFSCTGKSYNGKGCTARLMEKGYKVDY